MRSEFEYIKSASIESIRTISVQGEPEERAFFGVWDLPTVNFHEVGYRQDQVVEGMEFEYRIRQRQGKPLKVVNFLGILPPVEEVVVREPYSGPHHTEAEVEE